VNFDSAYCLWDLYVPRVSRDNNTVGDPCRIGPWFAGQFRWLHDAGWERQLMYELNTLVTAVALQHQDL
jgi:hypothetical protein